MPFFLTAPSDSAQISPGTKLDRVGMHADIAPTLLDLLGLWKAESERNHGGSSPGARLPKEGLSHGGGRVLVGSPGPSLRGLGGQDAAAKAASGISIGASVRAGSGLIGDSLLGPDQRHCAVGATHYGGKTIAVMAGNWKGVFLYRWAKHGYDARAEVRMRR